jgi:tetratricopeptide (TPR) repeat protein
MEAAEALEGDEAIEARTEKVEWAFDELIDQSRSFFLNAVEKDPSDPDAQFRLGNFYQTLGKFSDAEKCYRECAAIDSTHVDAMNNLALLLQEAGKIDEAEAYYLRCVECDPKCVDAMFNWATLKLEHRQDLDGCRVLINQIVQINPELKEHKLVKALRGDDEDESGETFG